MKKLISVILCVLLCLTAFAGCGNKNDTESKKAKTKNKSSESQELTREEIIDNAIDFWNNTETIEVLAEITIDLSANGESATTKSSVETLYNIKDQESYAKITITQADQSQIMETYVNSDSQGYNAYLNSNSQWYKQSGISEAVASANALVPERDKVMMTYLESCKENGKLEEDSDYYIFSSGIDSSDIETMKTSPLKDAINSLLELGMTEDEVNDLLANMGDFFFTIYIEKDTFAPAKLEVNMKEAMNTLMTQLYELSGYADLNISVDNAHALTEYSNFNKDFKIEIPEEALNGTELELYK